jgi:hypothetical protein
MRPEMVTRLFNEQVAQCWDWSQPNSAVLPALRQAVMDAAAGRLDDAGLVAAASRGTGNPDAAAARVEQCRSVVRAARMARDARDCRERILIPAIVTTAVFIAGLPAVIAGVLPIWAYALLLAVADITALLSLKIRRDRG